MADLGAIGVAVDDGDKASSDYDFFSNAGYPLSNAFFSQYTFSTGLSDFYQQNRVALGDVVLTSVASTQTYSISGTVKENNTAVAGRKVRVFARDSGALLGETVSVTDGAFSISLVAFNSAVTVVAYDDESGSVLNASVFDRIIPT